MRMANARRVLAAALPLLMLAASVTNARVMRGDAIQGKGQESKRAQLRNMLRGLKQVKFPPYAPYPPNLPDASGPVPSSPDASGSIPSSTGGSGSGMTSGSGAGAMSYPPWAPFPPQAPGDVQRAPGPSDSTGSPSYPSWYNWNSPSASSPPWWSWPSSWSAPAREPTLLERIRDGLRNLAGDLGLWDLIDFVEEVAPLVPEIVADVGTLAGYVDELIQNPNASDLLNADGATSTALYKTLRDTLLVLLSTDTGSQIGDELLDVKDIDLAAAATAEDLPSMLRVLGSGIIVSDLPQADDYQIADFALGFVELATGIIDEAVRPDSRLSLFTVATDALSVAAQAAETFSANFGAAAAQADRVEYQQGKQWYALRRLTANLQSAMRDPRSDPP
ncbi:hypothetical protein HXX76_002483 [Chlamydomonas incerta]|uniref:Uncharacterized protein n=1 Tax=Chlamydomonas incerta TaxID=51695 RepID=A0A835TES7_CHLIN|nr:hypothetical protein HXX76_002483 [Chlamydomonas incerta]|eukprot:KAG2442397.1 hypothetical protein HXX76_002483 [Chlamydomonas incerta]